METLVQVLGLLTLIFLFVKFLSILRSCCIMWLGNPPDFTKYGRWAVVTGCTQGIGKAYALELSRLGMDIVLISILPSDLRSTAQEIESKYKSRTKIIEIDFTGGRDIYDRIKKELLDLDIGVLVNNVGMCLEYPEYFLEVDQGEKLYRDIIQCNTASVTFMTQMVLPKMVEKRKGVIINISSLTGSFPCPLMTTYAATKSYIDSLSHSLSKEYKGSGMIIQTVLPGMVVSKMSKMTVNFTQESLSLPSTTTFVKSALKTVGKLDRTAGYWFHEIQLGGGDLLSVHFSRYAMTYLSTRLLQPAREGALKMKNQTKGDKNLTHRKRIERE